MNWHRLDKLNQQDSQRRLGSLFQGSLVVLFGYALFALVFPNEALSQVMLYLGIIWLFLSCGGWSGGSRRRVSRAQTGPLSTEERFTIRSRLQGGLGGPKAERARPLNDFPGLESQARPGNVPRL